jgi:hypothetical protein
MDATPRSGHAAHRHDPPWVPVTSPSFELWRVRGATDDLRGLAIETSFGYALGLALDRELVLLLLQPSLEVLVAYADRIETALLAQGWQRLTDSPSHRQSE